MKRNIKITTTVIAMILVLALMCAGIFAATQVSLSGVGSTISYTALDVSASVRATKQMNDAEAVELTVPENGEYLPSFQAGQSYAGEITIGEVVFAAITDKCTVTVTVTNTFDADVKIKAAFSSAVTHAEGKEYVVMTLAADGTEQASASAQNEIEAQASVTYTITLSVTEDETLRNEALAKGFSGIPFAFTLVVTRVA